jgi:xanthine dehydrogenase accessory factor
VNAPLLIDAPVYKDFVLEDLKRWRDEGLRTALLTLVKVEGRSPRPLGSQMAVAEDGQAVGAITGGCAERALVLDALAAIGRGENHTELYGEGSRFKDIVLPCGSGLHVHFDVCLPDETLDALLAARGERRMAELRYDLATPYVRTYVPQCRLAIVGQGPITVALAQMATLAEMAVEIFTPDRSVVRAMPAALMAGPDDFDVAVLDAWTALAMTFHDHGYEAEILRAAVDSQAFFIGALGSRPTHGRRLETLAAMGATPGQLARIQGPIGLDIGARTPPEIAVAVLAQVVSAWRCAV